MTSPSQPEPAISQIAIELAGVNLSLGQGAARVHILKGIDLNIGKGEAIGLIGPSGSGKSTLLMVMAGLERADAGSVSVAGEELGRLDEDALARFRGRNIGIVFQSFHLIPTMTALENVAVPLELAGDADAFARAARELAPNLLTTYLTELAATWNNFYATEQVLGSSEEVYKQRVARAFANTMTNGLTLLGIPAPERM